RIGAPILSSSDQHGAVPTAYEVTAPPPDVAVLMKPAVAFDPPAGRTLDRVRVVDHRPAIQPDVVEPLVQEYARATVGRKDLRHEKDEGETFDACDARSRHRVGKRSDVGGNKDRLSRPEPFDFRQARRICLVERERVYVQA